MKLFLIENGTLVVVKNNDLEFFYATINDFTRDFPKINLNGKYYLDYEPDRSLYIDDQIDPNKRNLWNGNIQLFDEIIESIQDILNKHDIYYGLDLDGVKTVQKNLVKKSYERALLDGYMISPSVNYDCDDRAINNIMAAMKLMELTNATEIEFIDHENVKHTLTYDELKALGLQIGFWWQSLLYQKNTIYSQIDACETIDDVRSIYWSLPATA
ncbi:hypothetical protein [Desulfatirhabdium butyrativorans]|uniref:DUF4376 domain-containing protein n=1 Tax=Desulfatirhabdium butyrativorans TaxID=340467 RepID=UPI000481EC73|nr:hypothetical protein [Desulfatirhabdium butyrativorans]